MKALRFHASKDLRIEDLEPPADMPPPGRVRVRYSSVGICGTDLPEYDYGPIFIPHGSNPLTTINPTREMPREVTRTATEGGSGFDVANEAVHNQHRLKDRKDALRKQGNVVVMGLHPHENPLNWFQVTFKDKDIRGSWRNPTHYWPRVIMMISSGLLAVKQVVSKKTTFNEAAAEGLDALLDPGGKHLKSLIDIKGQKLTTRPLAYAGEVSGGAEHLPPLSVRVEAGLGLQVASCCAGHWRQADASSDPVPKDDRGDK